MDAEPATPEPADRPDLDMDHFTPGATVPPQRKGSAFKPPEQIRGVPTENQDARIERLEDKGFGTIEAKRIVLGPDFTDPGPPPGVNTPEKPKKIKVDRRRLGPQGKIIADEPVPEAARAEASEVRVDESAILGMSEDERQANAKAGREILDNLQRRIDREDHEPGKHPQP